MEAEDRLEQHRCTACGRFLELEGGYFDRENREDEESAVTVFCDEGCADRYQSKRASAQCVEGN